MGSLMAPAQTPSVRGHWQGRVVAVTVHDFKGKDCSALALEVTEGPRAADMTPQPKGGVSEARGGGDKPLLARGDDMTCQLIDPSSFQVGQAAKVRGRMTLASAYAGYVHGSPNLRVSRERWGDYPASEHVILVEGSIEPER
jgi:hypothetical protein